jgi:hypothetical protein
MEALGIENRPFVNGMAGLSLESVKASSITGVAENEKPVASGNGVSVYICFAEPIVYLSGLDHDGTTRDSQQTSSTAILRGKLRLNVIKSAKIKAVTLKFTGRARTEWPEGMLIKFSLYVLTREAHNNIQGYRQLKLKLSKKNHFEHKFYRSSMLCMRALMLVTAPSAIITYGTNQEQRL